jgi:hypothetical protein
MMVQAANPLQSSRSDVESSAKGHASQAPTNDSGFDLRVCQYPTSGHPHWTH